MSYRHVHVTSFLYEEPDRVEAFIRAAEAAAGGFFAAVLPVRRGGGRVIAVVLYSKDLDAISDQLDTPEIAESLSGILQDDIEIVSAWQAARPDAQRVWTVRGASSRPGRVVAGEVVRARPATGGALAWARAAPCAPPPAATLARTRPVPPTGSGIACAPVRETETVTDISDISDISDDFAGERPRCAHCGRRVARNARSAILHAAGTRSDYCAHRRACRRAMHESAAQGPLRLPYETRDLADETLGAALIAADYIPLPFWARLIPARTLDRLRREAAVQIGGAVHDSVLTRSGRG